MTETITIDLGRRSYDVIIGDGALETALSHSVFRSNRRYAVLVDARVAQLHAAKITAALGGLSLAGDTMEIPDGEGAKSFDQLENVLSRMLDQGLERGDAVLAVGGGVTGDLAGLAAALFKRGIDIIQIPTTLLSMADSSVGGKTAINMPQGKNLVGVFHQPSLVIADLAFLSTLPDRQIKAGYAEIIKAALIGDADFFARQEGSADVDDLQAHLKTAIAFKARIVAADERETGSRALLNFGHTFGHALESEANGALLHGEAVAAGLALAFDYSVRLGVCPAEDANRVRDHLQRAGLETRLPGLPGAPFSAESMLDRMRHDKKNSGGTIRLVLARGIGNAFIHDQTDPSDLLNFLKDQIQ
jgi:3-dehydroquinate synthase